MKKIYVRLINSSRVGTTNLSAACEKLRAQLGDACTSHQVGENVGIFTLHATASKYVFEAISFMGFRTMGQRA